MKRIAIKVGSNVLTRDGSVLDHTRISALVDQIAQLRRRGIEVILISSGAVAAGKGLCLAGEHLDDVSKRQLYSAVGQVKLVYTYYELFREYGYLCGQVLTIKENFFDPEHYKNQKNCMEAMLEHGVIPIVNENDTTSVTELMFTDNDELAGLVTRMTSADMLIILSNSNGICKSTDPDAEVIPKVLPYDNSWMEYIRTDKSSAGRGGMMSKCNFAASLARDGYPVIIANGKRNNVIIDVMDNPDAICTRFVTR